MTHKPRLLLGLITSIVTMLIAGLVLVATATSSAETPAERCARETATYNQTWKQAWVIAHPGTTIAQAPDPNPPYICGQDDPPPTLPTTTPTITPETPPPSETPPTSTDGPGLNPPTSITNPVTPTGPQPTIDSGGEQSDEFGGSPCDAAAKSIVRKFIGIFTESAKFECSSSALINVRSTNPANPARVLGNVLDGRTVDVTGFNQVDLDLTKKNLASEDIVTGPTDKIRIEAVCRKAQNLDSVSQRILPQGVDGSWYQGEMIVRFCYGIVNRKSLEVTYWNRAEFTFRTNLGARYRQEIRFNVRYAKGASASMILKVDGRLRKDVAGGDDLTTGWFTFNYTGDQGTLDTSSGYGIYFFEYMGATVIDSVGSWTDDTATEMWRFRCPKSGVCKYPYGNRAPTHYAD